MLVHSTYVTRSATHYRVLKTENNAQALNPDLSGTVTPYSVTLRHSGLALRVSLILSRFDSPISNPIHHPRSISTALLKYNLSSVECSLQIRSPISHSSEDYIQHEVRSRHFVAFLVLLGDFQHLLLSKR